MQWVSFRTQTTHKRKTQPDACTTKQILAYQVTSGLSLGFLCYEGGKLPTRVNYPDAVKLTC